MKKKRELNFLKKKISTLSLDTDSNTNHNINSNENENLIVFEKGSINEKILNLNKSNLGDLDALYFFDKIEMKHKRSFSQNIPFLKLKKEENIKISVKKNKNNKFINHENNKSENIYIENNYNNDKNNNNNENDNNYKNDKKDSNFKKIKEQFML